MITTLTIIHSVISVLLIGAVLLQFGKGAEAGLFMDSASSSVFNSKGDAMTRVTSFLAIIFLSLSLGLSAMRGHKAGTSIFDDEAPMAAPLGDPSAAAVDESMDNSSQVPATKSEKASSTK